MNGKEKIYNEQKLAKSRKEGNVKKEQRHRPAGKKEGKREDSEGETGEGGHNPLYPAKEDFKAWVALEK